MSPLNGRSSDTSSKVFTIGSINVDHIYHCPRLPSAGFCVVAPHYTREIGGKGLNQAFALFQAGVTDVKFGGFIGHDGIWMKEYLTSVGFPTEAILLREDIATGNCVIFHRESDKEDNAFMLHLGANATFDLNAYEQFLQHAKRCDYLVAQNESNQVSELMLLAKKKGMVVVFNPAPIPPSVDAATWRNQYPADILILNKLEATTMANNFSWENSGKDNASVDDLIKFLADTTLSKMIIVTNGGLGAHLIVDDTLIHCPSFQSRVADTTGAGDTFLGYFISHLIENGYEKEDLEKALLLANAAAAVSISRHGTLKAIPLMSEVVNFINQQNK